MAETSVAIVLFSEKRDQVLLIQRRDVPVFVLPGGGIEEESPEKAAIREMLEETGLSISELRLVGVYHPINRLAKKTYLFEPRSFKGVCRTSSETKQVCFFPLNKLPPMPPPYQEWIEDALLELDPIEHSLSSVTYIALLKNIFLHPILVFRFLLARLQIPWNS